MFCFGFSVNAQSTDEPAISFHTNIYNTYGSGNAFSLVLGSTDVDCKFYIDCGFGKEELTVNPAYYDEAPKHLDMIYNYIQANRLLELNPIYNINIPPNNGEFRITRQGGPYFSDDFAPEVDNLYRPCGKPVWVDQNDDTYDTDATQHGYISVMPLTINRTNWAVYDKIKDLIV
jgi:hypothetical protein